MARIVWDQTGEKVYETGVNQGVLYELDSEDNTYKKGVAWNGLTTVTETPSGAEATAIWADNIKYLSLMSAEQFGGTIEAYTYPDKFAECDGTAEIVAGVKIGQQTRKTFGFSYKTIKGNDVKNNDYGYLLHLVYGCLASPSQRAYATVNDSPSAITFSWTFTTTPVNVTGFTPTSLLTIDSTKVEAEKLARLEDILYGTTSDEPRMPLPDEVMTILGGTTPPVGG